MTDKWKDFNLEEVADIVMGQSPPSNYYNIEGNGLPFFQGRTEFGERFPSIRQYTTKVTKKADENSILFTVRAPVGELNITKFKCCIGRGLAAINAKNNEEQEFIYYAIKVNIDAFLARSYGAVYDAISGPDLRKTKINLPISSRTRIQIAKILSSYDDLIENNLHRIKLLEEWALNTFNDLYSFNKEFEEVNLGSLIGHEIGGGWGNDELTGEFNKSAYVIRGTDIDELPNGKLEKVPLRYHKKSNLASRKLQDGDIIFEVSGGSSYEGVAKTLLVTEELLKQFDNAVMPASFCKLARPAKREYSIFVFLFLRFLRNIRGTEVFEIRSASNIVNYNWTAFLKFQKVKKPSDDVLEKFNIIVEPIYKQIYILGNQNQYLKEARDILLPRLMTGMIDVSEIGKELSMAAEDGVEYGKMENI